MSASTTTVALARKNRNHGLRWGVFVVSMIAFTVVLWVGGGIICDWAGIGVAPGVDLRSEVRIIGTAETSGTMEVVP